MKRKVYQNLNKSKDKLNRIWSVQDPKTGRVEAHVSGCQLTGVTFHVGESSRQRVLERKCRSVHAWATGEMVDDAGTPSGKYEYCTYNPYRAGYFHLPDGTPVYTARAALFRCDGMFVLL